MMTNNSFIKIQTILRLQKLNASLLLKANMMFIMQKY